MKKKNNFVISCEKVHFCWCATVESKGIWKGVWATDDTKKKAIARLKRELRKRNKMLKTLRTKSPISSKDL